MCMNVICAPSWSILGLVTQHCQISMMYVEQWKLKAKHKPTCTARILVFVSFNIYRFKNKKDNNSKRLQKIATDETNLNDNTTHKTWLKAEILNCSHRISIDFYVWYLLLIWWQFLLGWLYHWIFTSILS